METVKFEHLGKNPTEAIESAIKDGFVLARESADTHFITEHILEEGRRWKAVLRVIYEPGTAHDTGQTHFFIRKCDEYAYRPLLKTHKFNYVHVIEQGAFWETILTRHPDLELYDAAHATRSDTEGDSSSSGFIRPTLIKKPKQAFSGKVGHGPSI